MGWVALVLAGILGLPIAAGGRPGVSPQTPWACPDDHPIKGYLSAESGRVYYLPGHRFYEEASPERCYETEAEARLDGARPARTPAGPRPSGRDVALLPPR